MGIRGRCWGSEMFIGVPHRRGPEASIWLTMLERSSCAYTVSSQDPGGLLWPALVATGARMTVKPSCPRRRESRSRTGHCISF